MLNLISLQEIKMQTYRHTGLAFTFLRELPLIKAGGCFRYLISFISRKKLIGKHLPHYECKTESHSC